jgi:hypothetical protein
MSTAMMLERTGMPGVSSASPGVGSPVGFPTTNWLMVPRCTFKVEKCSGGMKMVCVCDDKTAASMVQNLCSMLAGGMCSCCCMMNGMVVCCCNFTMGCCKVECTEQGVCVTCTSGDQSCCDMIQACCDCVCKMMECGCTCCVMMNNTPVCCGCCDSSKSAKSKK